MNKKKKKILKTIGYGSELTSKDIAKELNLDVSKVQDQMKDLREKELIKVTWGSEGKGKENEYYTSGKGKKKLYSMEKEEFEEEEGKRSCMVCKLPKEEEELKLDKEQGEIHFNEDWVVCKECYKKYPKWIKENKWIQLGDLMKTETLPRKTKLNVVTPEEVRENIWIIFREPMKPDKVSGNGQARIKRIDGDLEKAIKWLKENFVYEIRDTSEGTFWDICDGEERLGFKVIPEVKVRKKKEGEGKYTCEYCGKKFDTEKEKKDLPRREGGDDV